MEERGFPASPSATADIGSDSVITDNFSFKSGPLFLALMLALWRFLGPKKYSFPPVFPYQICQSLNMKIEHFYLETGTCHPSVCPLVQTYLVNILPLLGHINLWKVNSCKGMIRSSMGFARFPLVKNLWRICSHWVCYELLKTGFSV